MRTILVADDEPAVLTMTALFLQKAGYAPLKAADGTAAFALLQAHPDIDAIVSDIRMPGMTGFELGWAARSLNPSLPILLMSGFAGHAQDDSLGLLERQHIQFLSKPFTHDQLITHVEMLFAMQTA
jgi:CheY-like chemotaxis protein